MKQKKVINRILIGLGVMLFSLPATAQLSLSAGAKAKADTKDGAKASGGSDASAEAASDDAELSEPNASAEATEEVAPPPPRPEPVIAPEPAEEMIEADEPDTSGVAGYDGGFFIKTNDGNFKLKINGRVHTRWNFANDEFNVINPNTNEAGTNHTMHSYFDLPYARIILSGNVFDPRLNYCLYWDISTNTLIYGFASWTFIPNKLQIKVGKFKRPISRHYLTSSGKRAFIRGPLGNMGSGLDTGIQLSNDFEKAKGLEWAAGIFNGATGGQARLNPSISVNDLAPDFSPVVVGRIGYNNGIKGYDDTDFVGGPLRFGVAFSAATEFNHDGNDNEATHQTAHYLSLDGMIKVSGLTVSAAATLQSQALEYFWDFDDNDAGQQAQTGLANIGSYIQGGYLFQEHFEPTLRYGFLHDTRVDEDLAEEITAGFNFHFFGNHAFKLENNLTLFMNRGDDAIGDEKITLRDIMFTTQLELNF